MSVFSIKLKLGSNSAEAIQTFAFRILSFGISLLFKIILARELTVEANGVFGEWMATFNYGIILFGFGLNISMIYYSRKQHLSVIQNFSGNIAIYTSMFLAGILFVYLAFDSTYYLTLVIAIYLGLLLSSLDSFQLFSGKILRFNLAELTKNIAIAVLCLTFLIPMNQKDLSMQYYLYSSALLLTFVVFFPYKQFILHPGKHLNKITTSYLAYGMKGTLLNVMGQSLYIIDIFIVSLLLGGKYLGLYVVAGSIARMLWFFVDAAGTILFPRLVKTEASDDSGKLSIYKISTLSFFVSLVGILIFAICGNFLIRVTFGEVYVEGFLITLILMIASPGMIFYKLINRYLAAKNEWSVAYLTIFIALIVNVSLNLALIPRFNILGAAFSSLISYWICGLLIARFAKFKIAPLMFSKQFLK